MVRWPGVQVSGVRCPGVRCRCQVSRCQVQVLRYLPSWVGGWGIKIEWSGVRCHRCQVARCQVSGAQVSGVRSPRCRHLRSPGFPFWSKPKCPPKFTKKIVKNLQGPLHYNCIEKVRVHLLQCPRKVVTWRNAIALLTAISIDRTIGLI